MGLTTIVGLATELVVEEAGSRDEAMAELFATIKVGGGTQGAMEGNLDIDNVGSKFRLFSSLFSPPTNTPSMAPATTPVSTSIATRQSRRFFSLAAPFSRPQHGPP